MEFRTTRSPMLDSLVGWLVDRIWFWVSTTSFIPLLIPLLFILPYLGITLKFLLYRELCQLWKILEVLCCPRHLSRVNYHDAPSWKAQPLAPSYILSMSIVHESLFVKELLHSSNIGIPMCWAVCDTLQRGPSEGFALKLCVMP